MSVFFLSVFALLCFVVCRLAILALRFFRGE